MPAPQTSSAELFDRMRAARPELGFALYALEPGLVTLEVVNAAGDIFTFRAESAADAIAAAFPSDVPSEVPTPPTPPSTDIFD